MPDCEIEVIPDGLSLMCLHCEHLVELMGRKDTPGAREEILRKMRTNCPYPREVGQHRIIDG